MLCVFSSWTTTRWHKEEVDTNISSLFLLIGTWIIWTNVGIHVGVNTRCTNAVQRLQNTVAMPYILLDRFRVGFLEWRVPTAAWSKGNLDLLVFDLFMRRYFFFFCNIKNIISVTLFLQQQYIGLVLMFVGIAEVFGGLVIGFLSDVLGRSLTMLLGCSLYGLGLLLTCALKYKDWMSPTVVDIPLIAFAAGFCFGIGDSVFNTQTYSLLGHLFPNPENKSLPAFTIFQFCQNIGSAIGFFYALLLPLHGQHGTLWQIWIQVFILLLSCILFVVVEVKWGRGGEGGEGKMKAATSQQQQQQHHHHHHHHQQQQQRPQ